MATLELDQVLLGGGGAAQRLAGYTHAMTGGGWSGKRRLAWRNAGRVRLLVALMLPVFFLRALVPAGFMPASAAQGQPLTMAMCPAHAPLPRTSPKPSPTSPARHHQAPCVFAAAAAGIAPLPTVAFCLTLDQRSIEVEPAPLASPPARLVPRANNPRAPPTHA